MRFHRNIENKIPGRVSDVLSPRLQDIAENSISQLPIFCAYLWSLHLRSALRGGARIDCGGAQGAEGVDIDGIDSSDRHGHRVRQARICSFFDVILVVHTDTNTDMNIQCIIFIVLSLRLVADCYT